MWQGLQRQNPPAGGLWTLGGEEALPACWGTWAGGGLGPVPSLPTLHFPSWSQVPMVPSPSPRTAGTLCLHPAPLFLPSCRVWCSQNPAPGWGHSAGSTGERLSFTGKDTESWRLAGGQGRGAGRAWQVGRGGRCHPACRLRFSLDDFLPPRCREPSWRAVGPSWAAGGRMSLWECVTGAQAQARWR